MVTPTPRLTIPTALFVPASSKATTDCVTNIIMKARVANSEPTQRMRKFGSASAAKVVENQRPSIGTPYPRPDRRDQRDRVAGVMGASDAIE